MCKDCRSTNKMQMQLTFVMLLFLLCNGLCSDIDQGKRAIEEEVLRSLLTSKAANQEQYSKKETWIKLSRSIGGPNEVSSAEVKQRKHIAPLWQLPLHDVCRMMSNLEELWLEEEQEDGEAQAEYDQRVSSSFSQMLEELHDFQNLCRVLQPREVQDGQEYLNLDQNSDSPLKRKSPYILKRQLRTNKSRSPYILKQNVYY